ncbi:MAG: ATP-binding protein [Faecalicatena sp.]|uniref:HAMP domain-containing sensor histidine kinase n=1 Tax=Faecalicatena sp. TaxID=2005360 RepID=UPI00258E234D|nr:ATP-binding protein [Faecalicatena sp.]MCI6467280.1 ATP-binding protein [Faecalicatena sp.]MDY5620285.1 ATP-binding protein [Lachnospiraceae bacterium]
MEKLRNLSLKKTIILYMAVSLVISFFLATAVIQIAVMTQNVVWQKYVDSEKYQEAEQRGDDNYEITYPRPSRVDMSRMDWHISEICDFLETWTVLILSILGSCIAVVLFYKNKLKLPIEELDKASKMISENELDFHISYENRDELGQLCKEFEKMRAQLEENNKTLWRTVEDEKALRAAIAHDIRSPLSVLRGYQEMLLEFVPDETLDQEKIMEMLRGGMFQIERMDRFIETMRRMKRLEERSLQLKETTIGILEEQISREAEILCKETGRTCTVTAEEENKSIHVDTELILEVVENLFSNAIRYAKRETKITIGSTETELVITVEDDGKGFTKDVDALTKAFYHSNPQDDLKHFGMGMYLSRIYCEKHGGTLLIGNHEQGGAAARAVFKCGSVMLG